MFDDEGAEDMAKRRRFKKDGRPALYGPKAWRPGILCTEELHAIVVAKARVAGLSVSDMFEHAIRAWKPERKPKAIGG